MLNRVRGWVALGVVVLCIGPVGAGCDEKKASQAADAGADGGLSAPVVGGKLGAALAAAAGGSAAPAGSATPPGQGAADGPPPTGVFAPGVADSLQPLAAPPKVELLAEGAEPKVPLSLAIAPGTERKANITVGLRMGPQSAIPPVEFSVSFKIDKPKADTPADKEQTYGGAPPDGADALVLAKVASVALSTDQLGTPPKELADKFAQLKGSQLEFRLAKNGAVHGMSRKLAKGAEDDLNSVLGLLADAIGGLIPILPDNPVGAGAYWMVTDRLTASGADIVRYRVIRVQKIDPAGASLTVEIRQFAADPKIEPLGLPKDLRVVIEQLESQGKAEVSLLAGDLLPDHGSLSLRFAARLTQSDQPTRRMIIQMDNTASIKAISKPK